VITVYATNANGFASNQATYAISSLVGTNISVGSRVAVNISPSLRVRDAAALAGNILGEQSYLAEGTVTGGPTTADGYTWWEINYDSAPDGWSIEGSSGVYWLIVAPPDGDTTAPSISILTPTATTLTTNASTISLSGTASDNIAVASFQFADYFIHTANGPGSDLRFDEAPQRGEGVTRQEVSNATNERTSVEGVDHWDRSHRMDVG
jgi:hypothetical protein